MNKIKSIIKQMINYFFHKNQISNIDKNVEIINSKMITIDPTTTIRKGVIIQADKEYRITIGKYCQLNPYVVIYGGEIKIGDNVMIAPHVVIAAGEHNYKQIEKPMRFAGSLGKCKIIIEDDVWIGANSTITDEIIIGKGAVIGANSVVTSDVPSYDIVAGVPAKKINSRLNYK